MGVPEEIEKLENKAAGAMTSTFLLTNAIVPYALNIANLSYKETLRQDQAVRKASIFTSENWSAALLLRPRGLSATQLSFNEVM